VITFKQFLFETVITPWENRPLDSDSAIKIIEENCSEALQHYKAHGMVLYRGFLGNARGINSKYALLDSSNSHRTSKDSSNLYMLVMDVNQKIPNRSKSIICASSVGIALAYGTPYAVFPFDNTPIAASSEDDFFSHPVKENVLCGATSISALDDVLVDFIKLIDDNFSKHKATSLEAMDNILRPHPWVFIFLALIYHKKYLLDGTPLLELFKSHGIFEQMQEDSGSIDKATLENVGNIINGCPLSLYDKSFPKLLKVAKSENRFTALAKLLSPAIDKVKVTNISSITKTNGKNKECWFSGKCVIIAESALGDLK